jgi:AraC-like DNA-binding protein
LHHQVLRLQVQHYISEHLAEPKLTMTGIAATHHVSVRHLQKLFEEIGTTVSEYIRTRRLDQCRNGLAIPTLSTQPVGAIGMH